MRRVLIASSQTIQSRGIESIGDRFLVAIDEAHIDRAMSAQIVDHVVGNGGFAVGLTGTPLGAGIAGRWDAMVSGPTTYELAKLGYAVVPELIQRWRPDDADLEKVEIDNDGEYSAGSAGELMSRFAEMIAADIEKWLGEQGLNELPPAILFGATKANVEHQLKALKRRGITSATIFDTTKRRDRKNRIRAFEDGRGAATRLRKRPLGRLRLPEGDADDRIATATTVDNRVHAVGRPRGPRSRRQAPRLGARLHRHRRPDGRVHDRPMEDRLVHAASEST